MQMPSDYEEGYERARLLDPDVASNYIAHTLIGDSEADALVEQLSALEPEEAHRLIEIGMENPGNGALLDELPALRAFFEGLESPPDWVDLPAFTPGARMFHRNSKLILGAMVGGTLVEGFSTNISKSFFITGRLRDQGVRRLKQNNRHMVEIFMPGGMERNGDGWRLSVRVRLVHAQVRYLLKNSDEWDAEAWGVPLSSAHVGYAITAFSARLLKHMKSLGARFSDEERESFMAVWRYSGYLMGIPETILYRDEEEALRLFEIGTVCEPTPGTESVVLANSLLNAAPLLVGITERTARRKLVKYVYTVSRALIGKTLADQLEYPRRPTFGVLAWLRLQGRFERVMARLFPRRVRDSNFNKFTQLLEISVFDEVGISYRLPDSVYAEESNKW